MAADSIPKKTLGKTGLEVTRLGHGAMEIRGSRIWNGREVSEKQAEEILNAVLDSGINFIDTSNDYGRSEEFIGKFLSNRRSEFYLATKCGCMVTRKDENTDETPHVWTRENLFRGLHESLERMKTDYVDVMQLHNPSVAECEGGDLVNALKDMREQGKARWIGISTTLPHLSTYISWNVFDTFQIPYSALQRTHEKVISDARKAGIGTIIRGGVARGEPGAGLGTENKWEKFDAAGLEAFLEEDENRTSLMLRYTLTHPDVDTIIVGTLNPDHLRQNVAAVQRGPLSQATYEEIKSRLDAVGVRPEKG